MHSAQSFGNEWWTRQWIAALEAFGWETRLQRGRTYARTGRVVSLAIEPGLAEARVRGSRVTPYTVRIRLQAFPRSVWDGVLDLIAAKARYTGQLLAGEMPADIDELFASTGWSLFPRDQSELRATCTCPDEANPCKHIAAVHYVLGARFDADPFVLFRLRGMPRERLLHEIRSRRHVPDETSAPPEIEEPVEPAAPVTLAGFLGSLKSFREGTLEIEPPDIDAAAFALSLPRVLAADKRLLDALVQAARQAAAAAAELI
ncbi:MAG: SWIM zinc finger family protein [Chloroflexi bacterium]|nr:SWIM zinc finger family protein [Chloroflexota bacterium]